MTVRLGLGCWHLHLLLSSAHRAGPSTARWTSIAPLSRWIAPLTCPTPWRPLLSWYWPPPRRLAAMPPSPASHHVPLECLCQWRRTRTSPLVAAPTPSPPCTTTGRGPCQGPFLAETSQPPCCTSTPSLPLRTWTAPHWGCSTTVGWGPSGPFPPHQRSATGGPTSLPSLPPSDSRSAWSPRPLPTCATPTPRGRSMTLPVALTSRPARQVPGNLLRMLGRSCTPCLASCLMEKPRPAQRRERSSVSVYSHATQTHHPQTHSKLLSSYLIVHASLELISLNFFSSVTS